MRQNSFKPDTAGDNAPYIIDAQLCSQQETLGRVVREIMHSGNAISRKAICAKLVSHQELAGSAEEQQYFHTLIGMLSDHREAL